MGSLKARAEEYELLRAAIKRYGLGGNPGTLMLIRNVDNFEVSYIRFIRYAVIRDAVDYYKKDSQDWNNIADYYNNVVNKLEWTKWAGDQCFAILIRMYYGEVAESLLSPMKDFFTEYIGQGIAMSMRGEPYDRASWEQVYKLMDAAAEGYLLAAIGGAYDNIPSVKERTKKVCAFIAMFSSMNFIKNYTQNPETKGDITKAMLATFNTCTIEGLKIGVMNMLKKCLADTSWVDRYIGNMQDWLKKSPRVSGYLNDLKSSRLMVGAADFASNKLSDLYKYMDSSKMQSFMEKYVKDYKVNFIINGKLISLKDAKDGLEKVGSEYLKELSVNKTVEKTVETIEDVFWHDGILGIKWGDEIYGLNVEGITRVFLYIIGCEKYCLHDPKPVPPVCTPVDRKTLEDSITKLEGLG
jgi:hypothetical protein